MESSGPRLEGRAGSDTSTAMKPISPFFMQAGTSLLMVDLMRAAEVSAPGEIIEICKIDPGGKMVITATEGHLFVEEIPQFTISIGDERP